MEDQHLRDMRDRQIAYERDLANLEKNFLAHKNGDFTELKREVHIMRGELNTKIDALHDELLEKIDRVLDKVSMINITMAKWVGAGAVIIFIGKFILDKFVG